MKKLFFIAPLLLLHTTILSETMIKNRKVGPNANYGTHITPLITALVNTSGDVLEMGCGDFSTPILHALCASKKRYLHTVESDKNWMQLFLDLQSDLHHFQYLPVFENCEIKHVMVGGHAHLWDQIGNDHHWAVVFIDHAPGIRRKVDIQRLRKNTDVFVVHDTEAPGYGYEPVLTTFKYRYDYQRYAVRTTLVSDTIDVRTFFN